MWCRRVGRRKSKSALSNAFRNSFRIFAAAFSAWRKDKALRLGASLAYYTFFSIPSLLVIAVAAGGMFYGEEAVRGRVVEQFQGLLGAHGAQALDTIIRRAGSLRSGLFAAVAGIATLVIGATAVFVELQDALNTIWGVTPRPKSELTYLIRVRALALLVVIGTGFLLLISLVLSTVLASFGAYLSGLWHGPPALLQLLQLGNIVVSTGIITLLFAMIFRVLPDARIAWKDVWLGAAVTAVLFTLGKFLIGLYLGRTRIESIFGGAGSLAILLVWVYYSSQIFFFGAEFTQVYANTYGSKIRPEKYARRITPRERVEQGMSASRRRTRRRGRAH